MSRNPICVALDVSTGLEAVRLASELSGHIGLVKVGLELFCSEGPDIVREVAAAGVDVFLDLKFHDIPTTVEHATAQVARLGASMINVHALGGLAMMQAAKRGASTGEGSSSPPKVLAVTILTSLDTKALNDEIRIAGSVAHQVVHLAQMARQAGIDGVVCSAKEARAVRDACGPDFLIVTPGIRPAWSVTNDQKRVTTPRQAIDQGADVLVIGRPIAGAETPAHAAERILREIHG